jgi:TP901 family phage tail tape measure protein/lambda family phage tail tape measure protein
VNNALTALPTVLNLAVAGEMDLAEAALGATGVLAAFNMEVQQLDRVGDVFAKAAAMSNTSVSSMIESMRQASTVADQYGVSLEETAASLAVLAKRNIIGSASGTAFRNMMSELAAPTDKAKRAMAAMGLQLYDSENKLKSFQDIMGDLRLTVLGLNEKGRLAFLQELFDERGAKAANALLSDFGEFQKVLKTLKEDSEGFTRSIVQSLGETTQGKFKRLISEFQLSAVAAFEAVQDSANNFIDVLRGFVASDDFKSAIKTLTQGVIELSRFLLDHGEAVLSVVKAWVALRASFAITTMFTSIRASLLAAGSAATTASVAFRTLWGSMAGPLGLVVSLGATFLLLRESTSEATRATEAKANAMKIVEQDAKSYLATLNKEIATLDEEIRLLHAGAEAADLQAQAKRNLQKATIQATVAAAQAQLQQDKTALAEMEKNDFRAKFPEGSLLYMMYERSGAGELKRRIQENERIVESGLNSVSDLELSHQREQEKQSKVHRKKLLNELKQYNSEAETLNKAAKKGQPKVPILNLDLMQAASNESLQNVLGGLQARRQTRDFSVPKPSVIRAQNRSVLQDIRQDVSIQEDELKRQIAFERQLDEIKYNPDRYGPYVTAIRAERREIEATNRARQFEFAAIDRLLELRNRIATTEEDPQAKIEEIDREVQARNFRLRQLNQELIYQKELAKARGDAKDLKAIDEFESLMSKVRGESSVVNEEIRSKYMLKVSSPVDAARLEASLKVTKKFEDEIRKAEDSVNSLKRGRAAADAEEVFAIDQQIQKEEQRLALLKEAVIVGAEGAGSLAARLEAGSRTAEYGYRRFWAEYVSMGQSSADAVYEIMKSSTDKISDALTNLVMTGKLNFKDLARSILSDIIRVMTNQMVVKFLGMAGNALFRVGNGGAGTAAWGYAESMSPGIINSAKGNVVTAQGAIPLRLFASGGIARSPMMSIFGEGSMAEAYVPLPDGRSIPVTMKGSGGTQVNQDINITVNVKGGETNGETGQVVSKAVIDAMRQVAQGEIANSRRPGGLLYAR